MIDYSYPHTVGTAYKLRTVDFGPLVGTYVCRHSVQYSRHTGTVLSNTSVLARFSVLCSQYQLSYQLRTLLRYHEVRLARMKIIGNDRILCLPIVF